MSDSRVSQIFDGGETSPSIVERGADQMAGGDSRVGALLDAEYGDDKEDTDEAPMKEEESIDSSDENEKEEKASKPVKKEEKKDDEEKQENAQETEEKEGQDQEQKIKVKVNGKEEEVTLQELKNSYAGKSEISKRFNEFHKEKTAFLKQKESFDDEIKYIQSEVKSVRESFESAINEFTKNGFISGNPLNGVYNMLDKMGLSSKEFDKALFFHYVPEVYKYLELDENGRDAYLLRKENEWYQKQQDSEHERNRQALENQKRLESENSLKRQSNVSEEQFSEAKEEMVDLGFGKEQLNTENIIKFIQIKPFYDKATLLVQKAGVPQEQMVDKITRVGEFLIRFPESSDEEILNALGYKENKANKVKEELANKIVKQPVVKKQSKSNFDEDDIDFIKSIRRK